MREPRLADARLAREQHDPAAAVQRHARPRRPQPLELGGAADERRVVGARAGAAGAAWPARAGALDQLARLARRRDRELRAQPLGEALARGHAAARSPAAASRSISRRFGSSASGSSATCSRVSAHRLGRAPRVVGREPRAPPPAARRARGAPRAPSRRRSRRGSARGRRRAPPAVPARSAASNARTSTRARRRRARPSRASRRRDRPPARARAAARSARRAGCVRADSSSTSGQKRRREPAARVRARVQRQLGEHARARGASRRRQLGAVALEPQPAGEATRSTPPTLCMAACRSVARRSRKPSGARTVGRGDRRHENRDLRLLAGAAGVSALGDFLAVLPLVVHVQAKTGSAFAVAAFFVALWGPIVLRRRRRRARSSIASRTARCSSASRSRRRLVAAIALAVDRCGRAAAGRAARRRRRGRQPAEFALVPAAAGEERRRRAPTGRWRPRAALGLTAGPLLGGLLAAAGLLRLALVVDALSFVASALAALVLRARRAGARRRRDDARAGAATASRSSRRDRDARDHARRRDRRARLLHHVGDRGAVLRQGRARRRRAPATAC